MLAGLVGGTGEAVESRYEAGDAAGFVAGAVVVEPYGYDGSPAFASSCEDWFPAEVNGQGIAIAGAATAARRAQPAAEDFERRLAEETGRSFEAGRAQARRECVAAEREAERTAEAGESARRAEQLAQLMDSFTSQRDNYLERVEQEVVKLALAVAARILRREAQMDPLLLLGAVRVALGQLAASTQARLRVPAADAELWSEAVALLPGRTLKPQVMGEEGMRLGDCVLETDFGSVDLGVRGQLGEIERGFFDRAATQPVGAAAEQA